MRSYLRLGPTRVGATPSQRLANLTLTAMAEEPEATHACTLLEVTTPWAPRWASCRPTPFHQTLEGHTGGVRGVALGVIDGSPVVVSASADHTVRVWDARDGRSLVIPVLRLALAVACSAAQVAICTDRSPLVVELAPTAGPCATPVTRPPRTSTVTARGTCVGLPAKPGPIRTQDAPRRGPERARRPSHDVESRLRRSLVGCGEAGASMLHNEAETSQFPEALADVRWGQPSRLDEPVDVEGSGVQRA